MILSINSKFQEQNRLFRVSFSSDRYPDSSDLLTELLNILREFQTSQNKFSYDRSEEVPLRTLWA